MQKNCVIDDSKLWIEAAHKIKGGAGMIGATSLQNLCGIAQDMGYPSEKEKLIIMDKIMKEYENVKKYLQDNMKEI